MSNTIKHINTRQPQLVELVEITTVDPQGRFPWLETVACTPDAATEWRRLVDSGVPIHRQAEPWSYGAFFILPYKGENPKGMELPQRLVWEGYRLSGYRWDDVVPE